MHVKHRRMVVDCPSAPGCVVVMDLRVKEYVGFYGLIVGWEGLGWGLCTCDAKFEFCPVIGCACLCRISALHFELGRMVINDSPAPGYMVVMGLRFKEYVGFSGVNRSLGRVKDRGFKYSTQV